jgi:hypothetical protein
MGRHIRKSSNLLSKGRQVLVCKLSQGPLRPVREPQPSTPGQSRGQENSISVGLFRTRQTLNRVHWRRGYANVPCSTSLRVGFDGDGTDVNERAVSERRGQSRRKRADPKEAGVPEVRCNTEGQGLYSEWSRLEDEGGRRRQSKERHGRTCFHFLPAASTPPPPSTKSPKDAGVPEGAGVPESKM